ncbi:MAG: hypothetical protein Fues2KO_33180 [Fuerstiella sp.]
MPEDEAAVDDADTAQRDSGFNADGVTETLARSATVGSDAEPLRVLRDSVVKLRLSLLVTRG